MNHWLAKIDMLVALHELFQIGTAHAGSVTPCDP
jgi:hypothetical protein